ncbi:NAD(P)/FAD-dependent oxidoreductase [Pseudonocardia eucalypti]|uniref:NAD(P)/FAD-dependent oxidoreductase n=1 Tax=Pseudonocardia eucalypti TaxID=648755 RepID=A0ABP9R9M0_9PSEU|nr:cation diffusion facilitator CzcD-associated flavoprotein CzcO [Pseudonocardia eucalypti]
MTEHVDVLIVGAGLSGVGAACHLKRECPEKTVAILEAREAIGGTWDLFRYPGIRSDSDMFTLGYSFQPWTEAKAIADGPSIREYVRRTAREYGVDREIRFRHKVLSAEFSSADARWTVTAGREDTGDTVTLTCSFLFVCSGYYRYDEGYTPKFEGLGDYRGQVVHPQHWPEDLDYAGKRVVVIGSGATAVTLVPAMAETAGHVTMLQRTPSYVLSLPGNDPLAQKLRNRLPAALAYPLVRWKNMLRAFAGVQLSRRRPEVMKRLLRKGVLSWLPGYDVDTHFNPGYNPWEQRMCLVPDGDFFKALRGGRAEIVTDHIDTFTETGIRLRSGAELPADVVVTATGLNLLAIGGMKLTVDGTAVDLPNTVAYKGAMLSGVPNFAMTLGYTTASWTLRADLVARWVCRVLKHMDVRDYRLCTPDAPDSSHRLEPLLDLKSGYVTRSAQHLPKQTARGPWRIRQNYPREFQQFRHGPVADEGLRFDRVPTGAGERPERVTAA